jgi:hypothetical protein
MKVKRNEDVAEMVEHLLSKQEALNSDLQYCQNKMSRFSIVCTFSGQNLTE